VPNDPGPAPGFLHLGIVMHPPGERADKP